ncbi:MAG: hypothetical protein R3F02_01930 [Thiolinea sp.]
MDMARQAYLEKYPPTEDWREQLELWDALARKRNLSAERNRTEGAG